MALVGGLEAPQGRVMGHAGAWVAPGEPNGRAKYKALQAAGAVLVSHPEQFGPGMKRILAGNGRGSNLGVSGQTESHRSHF